jgi:hypothetical protein
LKLVRLTQRLAVVFEIHQKTVHLGLGTTSVAAQVRSAAINGTRLTVQGVRFTVRFALLNNKAVKKLRTHRFYAFHQAGYSFHGDALCNSTLPLLSASGTVYRKQQNDRCCAFGERQQVLRNFRLANSKVISTCRNFIPAPVSPRLTVNCMGGAAAGAPPPP